MEYTRFEEVFNYLLPDCQEFILTLMKDLFMTTKQAHKMIDYSQIFSVARGITTYTEQDIADAINSKLNYSGAYYQVSVNTIHSVLKRGSIHSEHFSSIIDFLDISNALIYQISDFFQNKDLKDFFELLSPEYQKLVLSTMWDLVSLQTKLSNPVSDAVPQENSDIKQNADEQLLNSQSKTLSNETFPETDNSSFGDEIFLSDIYNDMSNDFSDNNVSHFPKSAPRPPLQARKKRN